MSRLEFGWRGKFGTIKENYDCPSDWNGYIHLHRVINYETFEVQFRG